MRDKLLSVLLMLVSATNIGHGAERGPEFPSDVTKFIEDRESCDHFRGEPREFDESYKERLGDKAKLEEAERAAFLEKMTRETCHQLDERLWQLTRKYRSNKPVADKLAEFEYIHIGAGYVHIHKDFPGAESIREKLIAKGFASYNVNIMEGTDWRGLSWNHPLPSRLTIQIGYMVHVFPAQLAIETFLEYGPKDIGVVVLPKDNKGLGFSMLVGRDPVGNYHVYAGESIQRLLVHGLSKEEFRKFAK